MSIEIVRHIVDQQTGMEIMDVKDSHGRTAQFQCGILPGHPEPTAYFDKCIAEFSEQENHLKEHVKKFVPRTAILILLLLLAPFAKAAPTITVSASAVTLLGTGQSISITVQLIDPLNTGMLKVSGTGIIPIMRASTVTPGSTATVGPIYGNDVILNGLGNANTTYYQVSVYTVTGGFTSFTPFLQNFYAFTGSGTIDLVTATPLVPNFMNSTAGVSIPGNFLVNGTSTLSGGGTTAGTWSHAGVHTFNNTVNMTNGLQITGIGGISITGSNLLQVNNNGTQINNLTITGGGTNEININGAASYAAGTASGATLSYNTTTQTLGLSNNIDTAIPLTRTVASGTAAMTTAGIGTGACGTTVTVSATGVATTDTINFARNAAATIGNGGGLTLNAWPTANNVNFNYCNSSAGTITPTAMTINWNVTR